MELIHHYTSIDTLELILRHRKLRFGRLDMVDDKQESQILGMKQWAQYLFVSSWCKDNKENRRLWREYTNNRGIRISLPKFPFLLHKLTSQPEMNLEVLGETFSPVAFDELYTSDWLFFNPPIDPSKYGQDVIYVDRPEEHISPPIEETQDGYYLNNIFELAIYKDANLWKEQNEFRYIFIILPSNQLILERWKKFGDVTRFVKQLATCMIKGLPSSIEYFDVALGDVLDNVLVTLGPECSKEEGYRVVKMLNKYTSNGKVQSSALHSR